MSPRALSPRDSLVYGAYEPNSTTAGVPAGVTLTNYNAPTTTGSVSFAPGGGNGPNGEYMYYHIYGDVVHSGAAGHVEFKYCYLHGGANTPTGATGCVNAYSVRDSTRKIKLTDCTIQPQVPTLRDGIAGGNYEAYRCDVFDSVDGFGLLRLAADGTDINAILWGNYVHDLSYIYPDYANGSSGSTVHTDGTHNDCIQHQGGRNVHIKGNALWGTSHAMPGTGTNPSQPWLLKTNNGAGATRTPGYANGSDIIVQKQGTTAAIDKTTIIELNYLHSSKAQLNAQTSSAPTFIYRNNRHFHDAAFNEAPPPTYNQYFMRLDQRSGANIEGLTDTQTNVWADAPNQGVLLAEPRASGLAYDA